MKAQNDHNRVKRLFTMSFLILGLEVVGSYSLASAQIVPDNSLGNELSTITPNLNIKDTPSTLVGGGAVRGINLFHSFSQFNVPKNQGVYFSNPQGITNIIARVTGFSVSKIMGTLGVLGDANLFLLNPNGIIFGSNSALDLKGSFVATTADAIQFGNQGFLDTSTSASPPLLTVNPSGFLFTRTNVAPIINRSSRFVGTRVNNDPSVSDPTINLFGLRVPDGQSILLLGGNVIFDNGGLYALGGKIGIGSISGTGLVGLSFDNNNQLNLDIPRNMARSNISFIRGSRVDTSGNGVGGGSIQLIGKNIQLKDSSQIISSTNGQQDGGNILLDATDTIKLIGFKPAGVISTLTSGSGAAGNIEIMAKQLIVKDGAQIVSGTLGSGDGGDITINTTHSIEIAGFAFLNNEPEPFPSGISSTTYAGGRGGDIKIETLGNFILKDLASVIAGAASLSFPDGQNQSATGDGGSIVIKAGNLVQIDGSALFAGHITGKAGNIDIDTKFLQVSNGGVVFVSSEQGQAGNLTVKANSLVLDSGGLVANTQVSGANIVLQISEFLRMENESLISASASGNADGGNIRIDTPILLALPPTGSKGSDIVANALGGQGGNITINAQGVFGIKEGKAFEGSEQIDNFSNDIDASSQFGPSGQVQINTVTDPNQGLIEIPVTVIDPNSLVAQNPCKRGSESEFTRSGRGGLPANPTQNLSDDTTQVSLVEPASVQNRITVKTQSQAPATQTSINLPQPPEKKIAPAQGWVYNDKGEVVLVAYNPTVTSPQRIKENAACPVQ
jgi:filamentous hemagglutinin family protein